MIQNASSGLALQGVLVTRKLNDLLRRRNVVLKPPDDIQLLGRSIDQQNKTWYFTSEKNEGDMTVLVNMLGYSVAKLAKVRKDDIRLELCEGLISISEDENVEDSIKKKTYCSTVKYFILPIKSFSFSHHQLCLSSDALLYIKELDKKYSSGEQVECKEFLCKFGSHVYTGPLHLGGKYTFKSCESGFNVSKRSNVQKVQGEVITMQEKSNSTSAINSTVEIFLTGPLVAGAGGDLSEWVHLLEASKSAWSLIDRGTEIVPVWDILKAKHASDFDNSSVLVDKMKLAWEAMNKQSSIVDKKDEVVNKREHVTEIHIPTTDHRKGEKQVGATCGEDAEKTKVTEYVPTTIFQDDKKREEAKALIVNSDLPEYYPEKLTRLHSLQVREDTLDIATAKETRDKSIVSANPQLSQFRILQSDQEREALCKVLSENGLSHAKWLKSFQEKGITKPDQIQANEGNQEMYQLLSLDASSDEKLALINILKIEVPVNPPGDSIESKLMKVELDASYWTNVFKKELGIQSPRALEYVGYESYEILVQFVRKPWEKKALRKLLKLESVEISFEDQRKKRKEKLAKQQAESAEMLKSLKDLTMEGKDRQDKVVKELEKGIYERLQVPEDMWLHKDTTLNETLKQMETIHGNISGTLKQRDMSEFSMITSASSGLAMRGILLPMDLFDFPAVLRQHILQVPEVAQLDRPSLSPQLMENKFSSKNKEHKFSKTIDNFAYSAAASVKAGYGGVSAEVASSYSSKRDKEETEEHHKEETYSSTLTYSIMPLASFSFRDNQLRLSDDALSHLQRMEKELSSIRSVEVECEAFFSKFGSHACRGPLHFGGIYKCKSYSSGFQESDRNEIQALQSDAVSASVGISYGGLAGGSTSTNISNMSGNVCKTFSEALRSQTFLEVTITGGPPEVTGLPDWKNGLVASNTTWYLIDRGTIQVPVWDIIKMNHVDDFHDSSHLIKILRQAWNKLNEIDSKSPKGVSVEVKRVVDIIILWNEYPDNTQFESQLASLVEEKERVARKYLNPQVWATDYLSQAPLQQFLGSVIEFCLNDPSEHSERLKRFIVQLVERFDLETTRVFRSQISIQKWLYGTEELTPVMVCQDFLSMHKYFKLALESMRCGMVPYYNKQRVERAIQPELNIKATATVVKAVFCLRKYLEKTGQEYEDLFVTTMLYPFTYDPLKYYFSVSLTASDLEYLCEEFESESKYFFSIQERNCELRLQSYLFVLTIKLYNAADVSEPLLKKHLQYLQEKIGDKIKPEIRDKLVEVQSRGYDWEWLMDELESFVQGISMEPMEDGVPLENILSKEIEVRTEPGKVRNLQMNQKVEELFLLLYLLQTFHQKLTLIDARSIREDTLDKAHQSKATVKDDKKVGMQLHCSDPELFPFLILQKIMGFDHKCRIALISHSPDDDQSSSSDTESESDDDDESEIETIVHPMDGLLALLHCSDNFLRQDLMCRLATCQLAVPLLLPDPITHEPTFLLWALRTIIKEFRVADGTLSYSGPIIGYEAPIVSFLRIGHHSKSKSHLLNTVINTTEYATFFYWNCEGGRAKRILVNGLVEVSWYLPSNNDNLFPDAISFANLHGDAREHSKQVQFLSKVSCMHFVFLNENDLNDTALEVLKNLSQAPGGIAILQSERSASNKSLQEKLLVKMPREKWSVLKLFNKSNYESKCRIQKTILAVVGQKTDLRLEQCKDLAHKCGIAVDEDNPDCITGRKLANEVLTIVETFKEKNPGKSPKKLLLQSSVLWQKWAAMDKEQYWQTRRGQISTFEYGALQRKHTQMDMIRKRQLHNAKNLTPLIASFLNSLLEHKGPIAWYYLHWLKLILDNLSRELLPPLHSRYNKKRKELNDIQMQEKKDEIAEKLCRDDMNKLNIELINASFGPEHLLREMSQMYEAVISQDDAPLSLQRKISRLPQIAAQLLVDGFPLELMDGDAAHVPKDWISAVLEKVSDILKITTSNPQLFVLSVLGLQSTGKSTMMNTLFGVQFSVSAGRCTRGAFMQLLPVHSSLQKKCGFQYFLIIDTEGLRAPELDALQTQKHDNELATFVIGMADLTIINIKGEITGDMDDILQTFIHAFLRMKEAMLRPSCHFVHHNVAAVTADEKTMMGRFKIKDKLDRMTQKAAEEEGLQSECRYFSKVTTFDYEKDISFFPDLWTGSPPMAPVSPGYSLEAQVLKYRLIRFMQKIKKSHGSSFVHLKQHLEQLWKAVLHNNFKNLRRTFEIAAYNTLEEQYGEWSWSFKQRMRDWERNAQNELKGCAKEKLTFVYKELKDSLDKYVEGVNEELRENMNKYFEDSTGQEIIIKWKSDTKFRIKALKEQLQKKGSNLCFQLYNYEKSCDIVDQRKEAMLKVTLDRVQQLALQFEKGTLSDKDLEEKFSENWTVWMAKLECHFLPIEPPDIKPDVEKSMVDFLKERHSKLVKEKISDPVTGISLEEWGSTLKLKVEYKHFNFSSIPFTFTGVATYAYKTAKGYAGFRTPQAEVMTAVQNCANSIFDEVKYFLEEKQKLGSAYNPDLTLEMLRLLFYEIYKVNSKEFYLTHEFIVDMALICCGYAQKVFQRMSDEFLREHDPLQYMEKVMRFPCMKLFKDKYRQIAKEKISAEAVCLQLTQSVKYQVILQLIPAIAEDMRGHYPWFKTKKGFKMKVILDIGESLEQQRKLKRQECAFDDCALYLTDAKENLKHWIERYTNKHCNEGHPSRVTQIAERELSEIISFIVSAAHKVTKSFVPIPKEFHIQDWLKEFHSEIRGKVEIDVKELCEFGGIEDLANIQFFTDEFVKGLRTLQTTLITEFKHHRGDGWELDWKKRLYDILYEEVAGCTEQCPFCQEQCELSINYHSQSVKHTTLHRPMCLGGNKWYDTQEMVLSTCNSLVASRDSFRNEATGDKWHPYKMYSEIYPQWSIVPDQSMIDSESSMYWKWLVANFSPNIEELFKLNHTEIPKQWKKLKWEDVREWVKEKYNM